MLIKILFYILLSIGIMIFQTVYAPLIPLFDNKPNIFIVVLICVALTRPKQEVIAVALFLGFVQDVIVAKWLGFYVTLSLGLAYTMIWFKNKLFRESTFVTAILTFVSTVIFEFIIFLFLIFPKNNETFLFALQSIVIPEAILNSFISILFIPLFRKSSRYFQSNAELRKY